MEFLSVIWDVRPEVIPGLNVPRWYGIAWFLGIVSAYWVFKKIVAKRGYPKDFTDSILTYVVVGAILGARLGHLLFYEDPKELLADPLMLFRVWEGGLASHGAAFVILMAVGLFCWKKKVNYISTLDMLIIVVALCGGFIRMGNVMNSEIVGKITNSESGYFFPRHELYVAETDGKEMYSTSLYSADFELLGEEMKDSNGYTMYLMKGTIETPKGTEIEGIYAQNLEEGPAIMNSIPNHLAKNKAEVTFWIYKRIPINLIESIGYFMIAGLLYLIAYFGGLNRRGLVLGVFFIVLWGFRFWAENYKFGQTARDFTNELTTGQTLSLPLMGFGVLLLIWTLVKKPIDTGYKGEEKPNGD